MQRHEQPMQRHQQPMQRHQQPMQRHQPLYLLCACPDGYFQVDNLLERQQAVDSSVSCCWLT